MPISPLAGKPAPKELLVDPSRLEREYYERRPDLEDPNQLVSFGTSGHRGSPLIPEPGSREKPTLSHDGSTNQLIHRYRKFKEAL